MADHQHILAGRDIPADRTIPLRRNRDVVQPRQFFLACCSPVSPTHDNFFLTTDLRFAEPVFSAYHGSGCQLNQHGLEVSGEAIEPLTSGLVLSRALDRYGGPFM